MSGVATWHGSPQAKAGAMPPVAMQFARMLAHPKKHLRHPARFMTAMEPFLDDPGIGFTKDENFISEAAINGLVVLNRSKKFILHSDFSAICEAASGSDPATILRYMQTARLPYDKLWLEFRNCHLRGCLIDRHPEFKETWRTLVLIDLNEPGPPILLPVGAVFCLDEDYLRATQQNYDWRQIEEDEIHVDRSYILKWRRRQPTELDQLYRYFTIGPVFYGDYAFKLLRVMPEVFREAMLDKSIAANELGYEVTLCITLVPVIFRLVIATLALLATHIGGGPLLNSRVERGTKPYVRGRFLPAYEYRVLNLVRPMTAPRFLRRALPPTVRSEATRWHEVQGAWHHRRAATSVCSHHPRACPLAVWEALYDEDGKKLGADQQACELCRRKRWRIEQHARGDKNLGIVEKGYEVHGSRRVG